MSPRRLLTMMAIVAMTLVTGLTAAGAASAAPMPAAHKAGLTHAQAIQLQHRADVFLRTHPGSRQVSADTIRFVGGTLTFPRPGEEKTLAPPSCASGHLCIVDGTDTRYDFYYCGLYSHLGLVGNGTFNNNQTTGTVARFYNSDGSLRWTSTAKQTGTASWTPVYFVRPC